MIHTERTTYTYDRPGAQGILIIPPGSALAAELDRLRELRAKAESEPEKEKEKAKG